MKPFSRSSLVFAGGAVRVLGSGRVGQGSRPKGYVIGAYYYMLLSRGRDIKSKMTLSNLSAFLPLPLVLGGLDLHINGHDRPYLTSGR
jgi:hypothetical protein